MRVVVVFIIRQCGRIRRGEEGEATSSHRRRIPGVVSMGGVYPPEVDGRDVVEERTYLRRVQLRRRRIRRPTIVAIAIVRRGNGC